MAASGPGPDGRPYTHWLSTASSDGTPHLMPVGAFWFDDAFYFTSGPNTRKSRNLARNAHCVMTLAGKGLDLVIKGEATRVTEDAILKRVADLAVAGGWPATVRDGAFYAEFSAPSAGPPPWYLYQLTPTQIFGLGTEEPFGATRWRFS
jgi:Pyridoxamine 5'-phosphate oxidase